MRTTLLIASAVAALLTAPTFASAQSWSDPPGWRFQNRENRDWNGQDPWRHRYYDNGYSDYNYAPGATVVVPAPGYYDYGYAPGYYRGPSVGFGFRLR